MRSVVRRAAADEQGFTLIELMISIALLGIIIGPIISSFLLGLLEADSTRDRIADSASAQVTTAFLLADIQSAREVHLSGTGCLPSDYDAAEDTVQLELRWWDPAVAESARPADPDHIASYIERPVGSVGQHELVRYYCAPSTAVVESVIIQNLLPIEPLAAVDGVVVTCDVVAAVDDCASTEPTSVSVAITAESLEPMNKSSYAPLTFVVDARRRVSP